MGTSYQPVLRIPTRDMGHRPGGGDGIGALRLANPSTLLTPPPQHTHLSEALPITGCEKHIMLEQKAIAATEDDKARYLLSTSPE